jgi:1-acyl-sn-glycerol-3-phosphate acyltransferase
MGPPFCRGLWVVITRVLLLSVGLVRITFSGQINPDARFIIPNHECFFDGFLFLGLAFRPLGKRELLHIPCLTDMCHVYDGIAVVGAVAGAPGERERPEQASDRHSARGRVDIR